MPYSYSKFKQEVKQAILANISSDSKILDVGAGSGTYGEMLKPHYSRVDAIEIFPSYLDMFNLHLKYDTVIQGDIRNFIFSEYDFIIMGDVLEHLTFEDATKVLEKIEEQWQSVLVAVPYMYEQGAEFGNVHETHLQPDLTPEVMLQRYPQLHLIYGDSNYGYYVNKGFNKGSNQQ